MTNLSRYRLDFFVGLFITIGIVGVSFIALHSSNITDIAQKQGYVLHVNFDNVGGLVERSPVKSSGVRVGRVQKIIYDNENYVARVDVVIDERYQFPVDSIFSVVSSNLLGGQYIAIDVGGEENFLKNNNTIQGNSAIVLEDLISKFLFDKAGE